MGKTKKDSLNNGFNDKPTIAKTKKHSGKVKSKIYDELTDNELKQFKYQR